MPASRDLILFLVVVSYWLITLLLSYTFRGAGVAVMELYGGFEISLSKLSMGAPFTRTIVEYAYCIFVELIWGPQPDPYDLWTWDFWLNPDWDKAEYVWLQLKAVGLPRVWFLAKRSVVLVLPLVLVLWLALKLKRNNGNNFWNNLRFLETARAGSIPAAATQPRFVAHVYDVMGTYLGECFRVADRLYTAAHVASGGIHVVKFGPVSRPINFTQIDRETDLAVGKYDNLLGMSSGKFGKVSSGVYVNVGSALTGTWLQTIGFLQNSETGFGEVEYDSTTQPGYSGSPYFVGRIIYGMHLSGGKLNLGLSGSFLKCLHTRDEASAEWLIKQMKKALKNNVKIEKEERGGKVIVYIDNDYYVVDKEEFDYVEEEVDKWAQKEQDTWKATFGEEYKNRFKGREYEEEDYDDYDDYEYDDDWADAPLMDEDQYNRYLDYGSGDEMIDDFEDDPFIRDHETGKRLLESVRKVVEPSYEDKPAGNDRRVSPTAYAVAPGLTAGNAQGKSNTLSLSEIAESQLVSLPRKPIIETPGLIHAPRENRSEYTWNINKQLMKDRMRASEMAFATFLRKLSEDGKFELGETLTTTLMIDLIESYVKLTGTPPPGIVIWLRQALQLQQRLAGTDTPGMKEKSSNSNSLSETGLGGCSKAEPSPIP